MPPPAPQTDADPISARLRRIRRPWRAACVLWAIGLFISTHWPALQLPAKSPASDKELHAAAFGVLTLLLWHARWINWLWLTGVIALGWSIFDEWSQGLPGLNRWVTLEDAIANASGVLIVICVVAALRPVGGPANRLRLARQQFVWQEVFAGARRTWAPLVMTAAIVIGAALLGAIVLPTVTARWTIRAGVAMVIVIHTVLLWKRYRKEHQRVIMEHPCFNCGTAVRSSTSASCPHCQQSIRPEQWNLASAPPVTQMLRLSGPSIILIGLAIIAGIVFFALLPLAYAWALDHPTARQYAPAMVRTIGGLDRQTTRLIDLLLCVLALSASVYYYRRRIARFYDRYLLCLRCGHDLRGTPMRDGGKTCSECGYRIGPGDS